MPVITIDCYVSVVLSGYFEIADLIRHGVKPFQSDDFDKISYRGATVSGIERLITEFDLRPFQKYKLLVDNFSLRDSFPQEWKSYINTDNYIKYDLVTIPIDDLLEFNPDWDVTSQDHKLFRYFLDNATASFFFEQITIYEHQNLNILVRLYPHHYVSHNIDDCIYLYKINDNEQISTYIDSITTNMTNPIECSICLMNYTKVAVCCNANTFKGHYTCISCMTRWLSSLGGLDGLYKCHVSRNILPVVVIEEK